MTSNQGEQLSGLVSAANAIADETLAGFGNLTAQQLNWKPSADQWSVAQCFDHLVTANEAFFQIFEKVLSGEKKHTFWEGPPWLPAFWGKMLIKAVAPESTRKFKAPKIFHPSSSSVDVAVIRRFIDQQHQLTRYLNATEALDLEHSAPDETRYVMIGMSSIGLLHVSFTYREDAIRFISARRATKWMVKIYEDQK